MTAVHNDVSEKKMTNGVHGDKESSAASATEGEQSQDATAEGVNDAILKLPVLLPTEPFATDVHVTLQEQVQDVRQFIMETPYTLQHTCFHLEHNDKRMNDYVELSEIPGFGPASELAVKLDPYTEKEARMHFIRIRELIGAAGDRTDLVQGISAGQTFIDDLSERFKSVGLDVAKAGSLGNYKFELNARLSTTLVPFARPPPPKTVKGLALSQWHPPTPFLRTQGHLMYLVLSTLEGSQIHITSHVTGFYVSRSDNGKFDPSPKEPFKSNHSLYTLISELSPSFSKSWNALQEYNSKRDSLSMSQLSNAIPVSPWLVRPDATLAAHQGDITRTQEGWLLSGADSAETLRDWNEEFQSTRELPKETVQDRVFRERLTSKLFADYNEAATRGAVLVARGEVSPLNPTEERDAQIFVYNNVFFSFGADGVGTFNTEGGDEAARVATGKDVVGVKAVNQLDVDGLFTPGTVVVDYMGKRIVGQSIVPGIFKQREPGEHQIEYGGVEGKDIVAEHEAFVETFKKISQSFHVKKHTVWDKEDKAHELEASVETKGLTGTDGRKYVLDLYRLTPLDINWLEQTWVPRPEDGSEKLEEEPKLAKDGRKPYPHRMTVIRTELVDLYARHKLKEYVQRHQNELGKENDLSKEQNGAHASNGAPSDVSKGTTEKSVEKDAEKDAEKDTKSNIDMAVDKAGKEATKKDTVPEKSDGENQAQTNSKAVDFSGFKFALNPDVYSGQVPQTEAEKEAMEEDEREVRDLCDYLHQECISKALQELEDSEIGFPMDGLSLTALFHKRGINMRYLGHVAHSANERESKRLPALKTLAEQEMLSRAFKHVANSRLRNLPPVFAAPCLTHLLNCFLGARVNAKPVVEYPFQAKDLYPDVDLSFERVTPDSLWEEISEQVSVRYRYDVNKDSLPPHRHLQMLREICLKLGIQLVARDFNFGSGQANTEQTGAKELSSAPVTTSSTTANTTAGKKKKKGNGASQQRPGSPPPPYQTFRATDIANLVPILKECSPKSTLAEEAFEGGRLSIAQDQRAIGVELLLESLSLYEQIYGILHPEVAKAYLNLSSLYYGIEDKQIALELARKAVIVSERCLGVDSAETVIAYLNLGLFEHGMGNTPRALEYVVHALNMWCLIYGIDHPDSITTLNNIAVMLQSKSRFEESRVWFEAALALSERCSGLESVSSATVMYQLAHALALEGNSLAAQKRMHDAHRIFNRELGEFNPNTKEAYAFLQTLTNKAVSDAKKIKELGLSKLKRVKFYPDPVSSQTEATPRSMPSSASAIDKVDQRSIDELLKFIEGAPQVVKKPKAKETGNPKKRGSGRRK